MRTRRRLWSKWAVMLAGLVATPVTAQTLGQAADTDVPWWRVIGALVICLGLAVGAAYVLRGRLGIAAPKLLGGSRRMRLVETLRLSHQVDLCLLQLDGQEMLVAATPHGATVVVSKVDADVGSARETVTGDSSPASVPPRRRRPRQTAVQEA